MKKDEGYQRPDYPATNSPLKAIRRLCLDCLVGSPVEVDRCCDCGCAGWPFRFGMSPATARKHGKDVNAKVSVPSGPRQRLANSLQREPRSEKSLCEYRGIMTTNRCNTTP